MQKFNLCSINMQKSTIQDNKIHKEKQKCEAKFYFLLGYNCLKSCYIKQNVNDNRLEGTIKEYSLPN